MGIDFMNLLTKEDEGDTGIDSGDEFDEMGRIEAAKRRFSRQLSCHGGELEILASPRKRAVSFQRQVTQTSYRSRCDFTESSAAIAHDVGETLTFVSNANIFFNFFTKVMTIDYFICQVTT